MYDAGKYFCMNLGEGGWEVIVSCEDGLKQDDPSWYVSGGGGGRLGGVV